MIKNIESNSSESHEDFRINQIRTIDIHEDIAGFRKAAYKVFKELPVPSNKTKVWRKAPLEEFKLDKFDLENISPINKTAANNLFNQFKKEDLSGSAFISSSVRNVILNPDLKNQGVILCDLITAEKEYPQLITEFMGKIVPPSEDKYSALTHAFCQTGLLLYLPKGISLEKPIYSLFWEEGENRLVVPYILILIDEGASATFIQQWAGSGAKKSSNLNCGIVEIQINKGGSLDYIDMQSWDDSWINILHEKVRLLEKGNINWFIYAEGSQYSKTFIKAELGGRQSSANLTGVYLPTSHHQMDFDTYQEHLAPYSKSDLLFKGVVANQGKAVWSGMIKVAPNAEKVDAYQVNRNLTMCGEPNVDSIPGLEILADDVRCSHGVSIGEIDPDQIFYLKSRGISEKESRRLISEGFIQSALIRISNKDIQTMLTARVHAKLANLFC